MIKPNWDIFKAKFSENPQSNFEWFCYLLFCKEFDQPKGIFRYKNQAAIENDPIPVGEDVIGWQAKFYDTSLSDHTDKLLETLEKAKRDYRDITTILFYTNQEWGQGKGSGKKPKGLIEIEEKAKELGIQLEWKAASFFESPFVSIENEIIAKHFFTFDKSIFDLIEEQQRHTENILSGIQTSISFDNQTIMINRKEELEKIKHSSEKILVLSGTGGVGKTALIKNLYEELKKDVPFYLFKASEFELRSVNDFFKNFDFQEFIIAHRNDSGKTIIIDSAEKLSDLKNPDPFEEFLSILIKNDWKIIFTKRDNYLDVLNTDFFETYKITPLNIRLQNLPHSELDSLSEKYNFQLPRDAKLLELIRNPFYLKEYLKYYRTNKSVGYKNFKDRLWKNITKNNPPKSDCFQKIALTMSNQGSFFITPNCESIILGQLLNDGILGYEDDKGYFITHDIYEEWALEKVISKEFFQRIDNQKFFEQIGQSLPIRRSFRNWLSEQLLLKNEDIEIFIEEIIETQEIQSFWKDEILISVLLSDYSETFFDTFSNELLANNHTLLKTLNSLLQLACKEIDEEFFEQLGMKKVDLFTLKDVLTKPKGNGWKSLIKFTFDNLDRIGFENINFVFPTIYDWNNKFKVGKTTRYSSLIALQYYQWLAKKSSYFYRNYVTETLLKTIIYGSSEIKFELKEILKEILDNEWKNYRAPYYDLSKFILTKLAGKEIFQALPEHILQLADLFWTDTSKKDSHFYSSITRIEQYFGLETNTSNYSPASAFQTPIFWLLQYSLKETIDFIINFTNKSVLNYVNSGFDKTVREIEVYLNNGEKKKQYISHCLWNMYRGTSEPISPYLLQSIHMTLEKCLLEIGKNVNSKALESCLLYLLENSKSASISSVVASIVLAYPEKTFNVAKVLFKTKEFILSDTNRWISDQKARSLYSIGYYRLNHENEIYTKERIQTCEDKHRKLTLENLFLNYQYFKDEETSEKEAENRQKILWQILDNYHQELPVESEQSESDKTWRLYLSRMDIRKMNVTTEKVDEGIAIQFNPKIEPNLKEHLDESLKRIEESMKYNQLKLWSEYKMKNNKKYQQYAQYENNPYLALKEVKKIIEQLNKSQVEEKFFLFNNSIPAYVCSVLMRDHLDILTKDEKSFCKDIILEVASSFLLPNYQYQISDGTEPTISVLPILLEIYPEEKENIKSILLFALFNEYPIDAVNTKFNAFSIAVIQKLWKNNFSDAQSLLFGYLLLKPKYEELRKRIYIENQQKSVYKLRETFVIKNLLEENELVLQKILNNTLLFNDLYNIEKINLNILRTAFLLIPNGTMDQDHKKIAKIIISTFVENSTLNNRNDKIEYKIKHDFLEKCAYFVLTAQKQDIQDYLTPISNNFNSSELIADLLEEFILAEYKLNTYDKFWLIWQYFKENIFEICKDKNSHRYVSSIVKSYLFARVQWKETAKDWRSLKEKDKKFFKEIAQKTGHCPATLYAISKLLNDIGSSYLDDGIDWISGILSKNENLYTAKLETYTIDYMEKIVQRYIHENREKIRKTKTSKCKILKILDFLIEKESVIGYMLRESIL